MTQKDTLSGRTRLMISVVTPSFGPKISEILGKGAESYCVYLHSMYAYVRASVPLMEAALQVLGQSGGPQEQINFLKEHIEEEEGHDRWLIEDAAACGYTLDESDAPYGCELAAVVGSQYYHILHGKPELFFAYMFALESFPPEQKLIDAARRIPGIPENGVRSLQEHLDLDSGLGGHADVLGAMVDGFDLTPSEEQLFIDNALSTSVGLDISVRKALGVA